MKQNSLFQSIRHDEGAAAAVKMSNYKVLYTTQKTKKAKAWQDGILQLGPTHNRAILFDDNMLKVEQIFINPEKIVVGDLVESERYLIQIDEISQQQVSQQQISPQQISQQQISQKQNSSLPMSRPTDVVDRYCCNLAGQQIASSVTVLPVSVGLRSKQKAFVPPRSIQSTQRDSEQSENSVSNVVKSNVTTCLTANRTALGPSYSATCDVKQGPKSGYLYRLEISRKISPGLHQPQHNLSSSTTELLFPSVEELTPRLSSNPAYKRAKLDQVVSHSDRMEKHINNCANSSNNCEVVVNRNVTDGKRSMNDILHLIGQKPRKLSYNDREERLIGRSDCNDDVGEQPSDPSEELWNNDDGSMLLPPISLDPDMKRFHSLSESHEERIPVERTTKLSEIKWVQNNMEAEDNFMIYESDDCYALTLHVVCPEAASGIDIGSESASMSNPLVTDYFELLCPKEDLMTINDKAESYSQDIASTDESIHEYSDAAAESLRSELNNCHVNRMPTQDADFNVTRCNSHRSELQDEMLNSLDDNFNQTGSSISSMPEQAQESRIKVSKMPMNSIEAVVKSPHVAAAVDDIHDNIFNSQEIEMRSIHENSEAKIDDRNVLTKRKTANDKDACQSSQNDQLSIIPVDVMSVTCMADPFPALTSNVCEHLKTPYSKKDRPCCDINSSPLFSSTNSNAESMLEHISSSSSTDLRKRTESLEDCVNEDKQSESTMQDLVEKDEISEKLKDCVQADKQSENMKDCVQEDEPSEILKDYVQGTIDCKVQCVTSLPLQKCLEISFDSEQLGDLESTLSASLEMNEKEECSNCSQKLSVATNALNTEPITSENEMTDIEYSGSKGKENSESSKNHLCCESLAMDSSLDYRRSNHTEELHGHQTVPISNILSQTTNGCDASTGASEFAHTSPKSYFYMTKRDVVCNTGRLDNLMLSPDVHSCDKNLNQAPKTSKAYDNRPDYDSFSNVGDGFRLGLDHFTPIKNDVAVAGLKRATSPDLYHVDTCFEANSLLKKYLKDDISEAAAFNEKLVASILNCDDDHSDVDNVLDECHQSGTVNQNMAKSKFQRLSSSSSESVEDEESDFYAAEFVQEQKPPFVPGRIPSMLPTILDESQNILPASTFPAHKEKKRMSVATVIQFMRGRMLPVKSQPFEDTGFALNESSYSRASQKNIMCELSENDLESATNNSCICAENSKDDNILSENKSNSSSQFRQTYGKQVFSTKEQRTSDLSCLLSSNLDSTSSRGFTFLPNRDAAHQENVSCDSEFKSKSFMDDRHDYSSSDIRPNLHSIDESFDNASTLNSSISRHSLDGRSKWDKYAQPNFSRIGPPPGVDHLVPFSEIDCKIILNNLDPCNQNLLDPVCVSPTGFEYVTNSIGLNTSMAEVDTDATQQCDGMLPVSYMRDKIPFVSSHAVDRSQVTKGHYPDGSMFYENFSVGSEFTQSAFNYEKYDDIQGFSSNWESESKEKLQPVSSKITNIGVCPLQSFTNCSHVILHTNNFNFQNASQSSVPSQWSTVLQMSSQKPVNSGSRDKFQEFLDEIRSADFADKYSSDESGLQSSVHEAPQRILLRNPPATRILDFRTEQDKIIFPSKLDVNGPANSIRTVTIPVSFADVSTYRSVFAAALTEHLNIQLFCLAKTYFCRLSAIDLSNYNPSEDSGVLRQRSQNPLCEHKLASALVQVKKIGRNQGRCFYACSLPRNQQCNYFLWADNGPNGRKLSAGIRLNNAESIGTYFSGHGVALYCECRFIRRCVSSIQKGWLSKFGKDSFNDAVTKLFLKLQQKMKSTEYTKDDLWIISQTLDFDSTTTFLAKSTFYGPSARMEVEIEPLSSISSAVWTNCTLCYAIHAGNSSMELSCLLNLKDNVSPTSMPLLSTLINRSGVVSDVRQEKFNVPKNVQSAKIFRLSANVVMEMAQGFISKYFLNVDQAKALLDVASMIVSDSPTSISLVHGVFGSGKSYLLSVVVLFLVAIFDSRSGSRPEQGEGSRTVLLSSTTNVAVDRVLIGLLQLGFSEFVRVGNLKKMAQLIVPYSYGKKSEELSGFVEKRKVLFDARVIGATCAACAFDYLRNLQFPVVLLDECSQMTEPAALQPIAKFNCQRLVLIGDPKQLDPTLQGSQAGETDGLEMSLFSRLLKMGYDATLLRTQYRCHPAISGLASKLFYDGQLRDGISAEERAPLKRGWPTVCFFDVTEGRELIGEQTNSLYNEAEAGFTTFLIQSLIGEGIAAENIGVITLYRSQQLAISQALSAACCCSAAELKQLKISTVDAFQGAERDVIILSCVRTRGVHFIDCDKRINVALTRAKYHLFIVGNKTNVMSSPLWLKVVQHCEGLENGCCDAQKFTQNYTVNKGEMKAKEEKEEEAGEKRMTVMKRAATNAIQSTAQAKRLKNNSETGRTKVKSGVGTRGDLEHEMPDQLQALDDQCHGLPALWGPDDRTSFGSALQL